MAEAPRRRTGRMPPAGAEKHRASPGRAGTRRDAPPRTGRRPAPSTGAAKRRVAPAGAVPAGPGAALPDLRIGCGLDVHPLAPGRRLVLGGVLIDHDRGLRGHSDADVLAHAACDAVLGAVGLPDLGARFPAGDEANRGRSSLTFLEDVAAEARALGFVILSLDAVILADAPRLEPHLAAMKASLARALGCPEERIGVKAKRSEGLGAIGRREGILAQAVALVARRARP